MPIMHVLVELHRTVLFVTGAIDSVGSGKRPDRSLLDLVYGQSPIKSGLLTATAQRAALMIRDLF